MSDNPLPAFLAFLAEDTKVGERTARQYIAHVQRLAAWLAQHYQAALLDATTRDLRQYKTELAKPLETGLGQRPPGRFTPVRTPSGPRPRRSIEF